MRGASPSWVLTGGPYAGTLAVALGPCGGGARLRGGGLAGDRRPRPPVVAQQGQV